MTDIHIFRHFTYSCLILCRNGWLSCGDHTWSLVTQEPGYLSVLSFPSVSVPVLVPFGDGCLMYGDRRCFVRGPLPVTILTFVLSQNRTQDSLIVRLTGGSLLDSQIFQTLQRLSSFQSSSSTSNLRPFWWNGSGSGSRSSLEILVLQYPVLPFQTGAVLQGV